MISAMIASLRHFLGWMVNAFRSREDVVLENLALRRQLLALHAKQPRRRLTGGSLSSWSRTVVNWHHAGFRLYWAWVSKVRKVGGRKRVSKEVRALIFRMVAENPTWGAPRIHGELLKLGFEVSERSVSRWIRRAPRDPDPVKQWLTFLRNHRRPLLQWISSPSQRSRLVFCTAFSSSATTGGRSCISM
jgi:putative transposase